MNMQQRKPFPIERRPKLLKDFLNDNSNSCSSSGFRSFPRHQSFNISKIDSKTKISNPKLASKFPTRQRAKAASTTISAFQAVINVVKNIPFTTVKSPSFLPRSLSRRLSRRDSSRSAKEKQEDQEKENEIRISVRVKDILQWTSFRDLVEEISPPLDYSPLPHNYTNGSTTTGSVDSSCDSSNGRSPSWCENDVTEEFLPSWSGNFDEKEFGMGKKVFHCVGNLDSVEATTETANDTAGDPQNVDDQMLLYEEDERQSLVSLFDFQYFRENHERQYFSSFDQALANVENMLPIRFESLVNSKPSDSKERMPMKDHTANFYDDKEEEEDDNEEKEEYGVVEEKARELLVHVKQTSSAMCFNAQEDQVLFDFFRDELRALKSDELNHDEYNREIVILAKSLMSGEQKGVFGWGIEYNREAYITEMHKKVRKWSKFEVEQEELALEIEAGILSQLIDGVLVDLFSK